MIALVYNFLLWLCLPLLILHYIKGRLAYQKYTRPISERFGLFRLGPRASKSPVILVHAVSVGETVAAQPLVEGIRNRYPNSEIIFSNVTETGFERAKELIQADHHVFFPLDYRFAVRLFINRLNPDCVFILETEIWPNFLSECQQQKIPVFFVNGRISDRSFERYSMFASFLKTYLQDAYFFMQTESDLLKVRQLGAKKTVIAGNLKFDQLLHNLDSPGREELKDYFSFTTRPIIVFGSTHQEETKNFLDLLAEARELRESCHFVFAPRHMNFLGQYLEYCQQKGFRVARKSKGVPKSEFDVMFLDTYGELALLYEVATTVIIGGSFEPIGGHSILEPALFRKPIIYGPHMENNKELSSIFEERGAALRTVSPQDAWSKLEMVMQNPQLQQKLGNSAYKIVTEMTGATSLVLDQFDAVFQP